jgi:hypothetical protein
MLKVRLHLRCPREPAASRCSHPSSIRG